MSYSSVGIFVGRWKPTAVNYDIDSPSSLADGQWHHAVFVRNSTAGQLYIDGSLVDSLASSLYAKTYFLPPILIKFYKRAGFF